MEAPKRTAFAAGIAELEHRMKQHKASPVSQLLAEVPGIGPVSALTLALMLDPGRFQSGRHFAAWLGFVPKERSTGGRQRLGGVAEGSACVSMWNGYGGGISRTGQRAAAAATGRWRHGGDPFRQAGQQERLGLAAGIAGAQAARGRGSGPGQRRA